MIIAGVIAVMFLSLFIVVAFIEGRRMGHKVGWQDATIIYQRILDERKSFEALVQSKKALKRVPYLKRVK